MTNLVEALNWHYAVKQFDPNYTIPAKTEEQLLESLRLAPSSFGLQLWNFVVLKDPKLKKELRHIYQFHKIQTLQSS